jgi:CTD kinase subunit alpha
MYTPTISASASDMPPPPVPVANFEAPAYHTAEPSQTTVLDLGLDFTKPKVKRGRHTGRHKTAGFKPIGQISSIKKFFPADDDDVENVHTPVTGHVAQVAVGAALGTGQPPPERERGGEFPSPPALLQETSRIHSPPHRETNVSFRDDSQPARETTNGSWKPEMTPSNWPTQLPDQEGSEITRPTSPSGESPGELYTILSQVGEGTFGKVYKARNTLTRVHVALKRIRMEIERDGFPVTAMREIKLLQSLRHGNVVRLYEMMVSNGRLLISTALSLLIY